MLGKGFTSVEKYKAPQFISLIPAELDFITRLGWNANKTQNKQQSKVKPSFTCEDVAKILNRPSADGFNCKVENPAIIATKGLENLLT